MGNEIKFKSFDDVYETLKSNASKLKNNENKLGIFEPLYELDSIDQATDDDIVHVRRVRIPSLNKKRHSSRKWKKKHGLLRRQRKAVLKRFGRTMRDIARAARNAAKAVVRFDEVLHNLNKTVIVDSEKETNDER